MVERLQVDERHRVLGREAKQTVRGGLVAPRRVGGGENAAPKWPRWMPGWRRHISKAAEALIIPIMLIMPIMPSMLIMPSTTARHPIDTVGDVTRQGSIPQTHIHTLPPPLQLTAPRNRPLSTTTSTPTHSVTHHVEGLAVNGLVKVRLQRFLQVLQRHLRHTCHCLRPACAALELPQVQRGAVPHLEKHDEKAAAQHDEEHDTQER